MLYFILLPAFLLAVALMCAFAIAARFIPRLNAAYPFAWRGLVGSCAGFVLGNLSLLLVLKAMASLAGRPGTPGLEQQAGYAYAAVAILGPVAASGIGFVLGLVLGLWWAVRAGRPRRLPAAVGAP